MTDGGWLDPGRSSFGGGGRRWRAQIQELEEAGRRPGRWVTADGFFNFDSFQSQRAMGLLQFMGMLVFFGGGSRRRGGRPEEARRGSRGINVIFAFLGFFAMFGWVSCFCILYVRGCICISTCTFS